MYELDAPGERTELAKDVTAMANALGENETGHIVLGVRESKGGGAALVGIEDQENPERFQQILESLTNPVPRFHYELIDHQGIVLGLLTVEYSPDRPFWVVRDPANKLPCSVVYVRRGSIIGFAKPGEIETMAQMKGTPGSESGAEVVEAGIVEYRSDTVSSRVVAAVKNLTANTVSGVAVSLDVTLPAAHGVFATESGLTGAVLGPGEVREISFEIQVSRLFKDGQLLPQQLARENWVWFRWLDCALIVHYRDREGFLRQLCEHFSIRG